MYMTLTPTQAADFITDGMCIGISGFAGAGAPKVVPSAIAAKARVEHDSNRGFKIKLISGASTGYAVDGILAENESLSYRVPYQSAAPLRTSINTGAVEYVDMHLSAVAHDLRYGSLPNIDVAIIEAADLSDNGEITLTTSSGNSAVICQCAKKIIVELNEYHPACLRDIHDVYLPARENERLPIVVPTVSSRIGSGVVKVDPELIVGVVRSHASDGITPFKPNSEVTDSIGAHVVGFLEKEYQSGRMHGELLPLQSGVGNIANAVLSCIDKSSIIPPVSMFTEVAQDAVIHLIQKGRCKFVSACSLTVSDEVLREIYDNFDFYKDKLLLRPQEISNNAGICRQLGIIAINTAIEVDIFGNVNSSHFYGTDMMNGIGGSGDFARNAAISIFVCPSVAKNGAISAIVPMVSHTDHTEHDVKVIVTEYGVADLRGRGPRARAELIIDNCAHPNYRPLLRQYLDLNPRGHTPHTLEKAFSFHTSYMKYGSMLKVKF